MIDVTDIPEAAIGDEVLLIGRSPHCSIGADDQARLANTIVYEILCGLSPASPASTSSSAPHRRENSRCPMLPDSGERGS